MVVTSLSETDLRATLKEHPYRQFPVVLENKLSGVLLREEAEESFVEKRAVRLKSATTCLRTETVGKLQMLLIESDTQFVIVLERAEGQVVGLVTLHDLLRAQTEMAQRAEDL